MAIVRLHNTVFLLDPGAKPRSQLRMKSHPLRAALGVLRLTVDSEACTHQSRKTTESVCNSGFLSAHSRLTRGSGDNAANVI